MASGQPDYTRQVAVTVIDTPDVINVQTAPATSIAVSSVPANMTTVPALPYIAGRTAAFEDTSFVTGDSPATHDVNAALSRNAHDGYIHNAGTGDLKFSISDNGTNYGGTHTLKAGKIVRLTHLDIDSIKITWVANTEYYILVV